MTAADPPRAAWADLLAEGRLPRFALICLGVWLNAADSLVTDTIMPSVAADLGGYGYFSWAVAGYFLGAIVAGASAGRLSERLGLRPAMALAGLAYGLGCIASAAAPSIELFLTGRVIQGVGAGWISGFCYVAIGSLFPERHLARVFASVSGVWGIAVLLGPLVGGLFAQASAWRGCFWGFALQAAAFSTAALVLLPSSGRRDRGPGVPWPQLALIAAGVAAIAGAGLAPEPVQAGGLTILGLLALAAVVRLDARARVRLLPMRSGDLKTVCGAGYATVFTLTAAAMGFSIYAPPILQTLRGLSPLEAGYVIGGEAVGWTVTALLVARAGPVWGDRFVRIGAVVVFAGLALVAVTLRAAPLPAVILAALVLGAGFGFCWSFISRRILGALTDEDRAIGSSAVAAVRQTGAATGAAIAGVAANSLGFSHGLSVEAAQAVAVWTFVAALPVAALGLAAAWRLTGLPRGPSE